jgi:hypothetical protein
MDVGAGTLFVGGAIGLVLALFGLRILVTGRAPAVTSRAFRTLRDAGRYHLLFGLALLVLVAGTALRGKVSVLSAAVALALVGVALTGYRPRRANPRLEEPEPAKPHAERPEPAKPHAERPGPAKPAAAEPTPTKPHPEGPGPVKPQPEGPGPTEPQPEGLRPSKVDATKSTPAKLEIGTPGIASGKDRSQVGKLKRK